MEQGSWRVGSERFGIPRDEEGVSRAARRQGMNGRPTITIPEQLNRQAVLDVVQALDNTRLRFEPNSLMRMQADAALKPFIAEVK
jgi:hypothetical protein